MTRDKAMQQEIKQKKQLSPFLRSLLAGLILSLVSALCVYLVLKAEHETAATIKLNRDAKMENMLMTMLPNNTINANSNLKCKIVNKKGIGRNMKAYIVKNNGSIDGYIINFSTAKGYTNPLLLIAGLDKNLNVHRVDIALSKETPGIGDKVDRRKSNYLDILNNTNVNTPNFDVRKFGGSFDYISGATVTSRAIVVATHDMLKSIQDINFKELADCQEGKTSEK